MKTLLVIFSMAFILNSCQETECPAFDYTHPINKWHWFPNNELEYKFVSSDSKILILTQTKFDANEYKKHSCYMCACFSNLETKYDFVSLGIQLRSHLSYQSDANDKGSLYFGIDALGSPFDPAGETLKEIEVPNYEKKEFNLTFFDNLQIIDSTFLAVTQLEVKDSTKTKVRKIYLAPSLGIIGIEIQGVMWKRVLY